MAIRILSSENITGNITLYHPSNAPYINFVENADTSDSKARITMDQVDTNNGTLLFATENAGTLYNQVKITQTGNLLLSNDAASFNTANAKLNVLPASSGVYQQWNYSPSNENFSLKLKETVTSGNVRYVFEQINNSTTYPNILVFNSGKVGIGTDEPSEKLDVVGTSGNTNIRVYDSSSNSEVGLKLEGDAKTWTLQNWGSGGDNLRVLNNAGNIVQLWDDNGKVAIGNFNDPDRTLDVRGDGMSIYGTGDYTELMLRGQVEGTGTVRNVGAWHWSVRGDVGGDNDDLKLLRFNTGSYSGTSMQVRSDNGGIAIGLNNQGYSSQILSVKSGNSDSVFYGESSDANCFASFRDDSSTANIEYGAIGSNHVFRKDTTEHMRIDSSGNVGIATTSPATKLQVANAGEVIVRSSMTAADGYRGGFEADNQHTGGTIWSMFSTNNSDGYFGGGKYVIANESMGGVDANTTAKFVIDGSGKVGIGTTSPSSYSNSSIGGGNTSLVIAGSGNQGMTISGGSSAKIVLSKNTTPECFIQSDANNAGTMEFFTNGTGATRTMKLLPTGQVKLEQYGSGSYTGTPAYNLSVDSSGNIIETSGGSGLTPAIVEQTWTFTAAEVNAGFGGSGYTLIAAPGSGKFVVVQESYWKATGTATSASSVVLEARQSNQIPGVQTVARVNSTQWNYMTNNNSGNGMLYRDAPAGGAVVRPYLDNQATTLHKVSGNTLPSQFTNIKLKLQYRIFDSSNM